MSRLAIDGRSAQYTGGGVPRYSADLIKSLSAYTSEFEFLLLFDEKLTTAHIELPPGSSKLYTSVAKNSRLRDTWEQLVLPRLLSKHHVDLFHGLDYMIPWTPCRFGRVVTMHDATVFSEHDPRSMVAKARLKMMIHLAASSADTIITDSDFSASQLERFVPSARGKITRIWAGVSNTFLETPDEVVCRNVLEKVPRDKGFILYYGGYRKYKNVHLLLRAYAQVAAKFPHDLVLVGSANSIDGTYSALIHELGLDDRVTLFGFATDVELKVLLANCAVFVFPSATEGFGLPIVEAMACGAPVVCSTGGSLPEIAGDAALYVNDLTADALASAIQRVLTNEDLRQKLLNAGILRSRQFRWSEAARQLVDVYHEVTQKRKSHS